MPEHFATLAQAFDHQARKFGSRTLLKQKRDKVWRDFTWSGIAEAAAKLRAGLIQMGIKPGDRVAILSDNSPQWVIVDQAILGLGAVTTPPPLKPAITGNTTCVTPDSESLSDA